MVTKKNIDTFFESKLKAVIGVSRKKNKFGGMVYTELKKKGFNLVPVNPNTSEIDGDTCFNSIDALPPEVDAAIVLTKRQQTPEVVKQLIDKGISNIWLQQESETPDAIALVNEKGTNLVHGKCIFMFAEPVTGFHNFHRGLARLFGRLPK